MTAQPPTMDDLAQKWDSLDERAKKQHVLYEDFNVQMQAFDKRKSKVELISADRLRALVTARMGKDYVPMMLRGIHTGHEYLFDHMRFDSSWQDGFERNYARRSEDGGRAFVRDFHATLVDNTLLQGAKWIPPSKKPWALEKGYLRIDEYDRPQSLFHELSFQPFVPSDVTASIPRVVVEYNNLHGEHAAVVSSRGRLITFLAESVIEPYQLGVLTKLAWERTEKMLK